MKVAIVEDEPDIARLYSVVLLEAGHTVWEVNQHNLQAVGDADLVILDLMMPGRSGEECLEVLKRQEPARRVVVVSAIYQIPVRVTELADVVLTKPIYPDDLLAALS